MLRLFIIILISTLVAACQNCICLPSEGLRLAMVSFDSTDVDTIVVRKFEKGNNFSHLIDTSQWDKSKVIFAAQSDTFEMAVFVRDILLKSSFDYQVVIPSVNRTFVIANATEPKQQRYCNGKVMCVNAIVSCTLNGNVAAIKNETLYLNK